MVLFQTVVEMDFSTLAANFLFFFLPGPVSHLSAAETQQELCDVRADFTHTAREHTEKPKGFDMRQCELMVWIRNSVHFQRCFMYRYMHSKLWMRLSPW